MTIARLEAVVLDCPNDVELRSFYQRLTGMEAEPVVGNYFPALIDSNGFSVLFQQVDGYQPPTWPAQERGQQIHLDFHVRDLEAGVRRAIELGATLASKQPGEAWRVMLDPAGHPFCLSPGDDAEGELAKLTMVNLDCPDPETLGPFYEALTGWPLMSGEGYFGVAKEGGIMVGGQQVENYQAPTWPTQERGQQMHLDFIVRDIDAAVHQALEAGATRAAVQPGDGFIVMLDPAGHPFCLTTPG
jgi:predicted enzyme related to lactoylglutathione lyase